MNSFYYFVPGLTADDVFAGSRFHPDLFPRNESVLGPALHDLRDWPADAVVTGCRRGPNGGGVVITPTRPKSEVPDFCGYYPKEQTWLPIDETDKLAPWIGWRNDCFPGEEDLRRRESFPGYAVADASRTAWTIPIVRPREGGNGTLPCYYRFKHTAAGVETLATLKPEFRYLQERAESLWEFFTGDEVTLDNGELIAAAVELLGVNYRLGPAEVNAFFTIGRPIIDDRMVLGILHAALDGAVMAEMLAREIGQIELKPDSTPEAE